MIDSDIQMGRQLFKLFPGLVGKAPWMHLADLPTPVHRLEKLESRLGLQDLWIKRDDLTSQIYGGNKPRKLEFLLADATAKHCREVLTLGGVGSNQAAALCRFCERIGIRPILALYPQPMHSSVRKNILVDVACQARFLLGGSTIGSCWLAARHILGARLRGEKPPYFIYFGGSSAVGNVGFVEAGLELAAQVKANMLPLPRYIFVPTGSCGTQAGLLVGLKAAGLPTEVIGVRVVTKTATNRFVVAFRANQVARYLRRLDPSFPAIRVRASEVRLLDDYYGKGYGHPTPEGKAAMRLMHDLEGLNLDPTYTGKTFAGLTDFICSKRIADAPVLYWFTLNSVPLESMAPPDIPPDLPPPLKAYFDTPLADPEL